jgi:hypothetical protein
MYNVYLWLLDKLEVPQCGKLQRAVLQGVLRLVHDKHVQHDIILVHVHVGFRVHRVREPCQLGHLQMQTIR